ncbi:UvrD-helicase domain-containing protein [Azospirillum sp. INR13]|uniref:UvrD-helicase domain-containing protein n=1 Tax=Azospirillum sp. INR13 TaxID=2596919 RepID=UPI00351C04A3
MNTRTSTRSSTTSSPPSPAARRRMPEARIALMAVGDDDQAVYGFRHADVAFIRRYQADYTAEVHHLVENYRSTAAVIAASNTLIRHNTDRMKTEHPIRIDRARAEDPAGEPCGSWRWRPSRIRSVRCWTSSSSGGLDIPARRGATSPCWRVNATSWRRSTRCATTPASPAIPPTTPRPTGFPCTGCARWWPSSTG